MLSIKVRDVIPLEDIRLLVLFEDESVRLFDVKPLIQDYPEYAALEDPALFCLVKVEPGGYGISWSPNLDCSEGELYEVGTPLPLAASDFNRIWSHRLRMA